MKFLVAVLLTAILAFAAGIYFPWWSLAIIAFLVALLVHQRAWKAFIAGFLGLFILWGLLALIIDIRNQGLLSSKVAGILPLGGSGALLIIFTAIISGLVAGLAAMSGSYLRSEKRHRD